MSPQEQLALVHIGMLVKDFIPLDHLPDDLDFVAQKLCEHLNITISDDDDILDIRDKVVNAYLDGTNKQLKLSDVEAFDRAMMGI